MVRYNYHDPPVEAPEPELSELRSHPGALQRLLREDAARLQELEEVCGEVALLLQRPDAPLRFPGLAAMRSEAERRAVPVALLGSDPRLRNQLLLRTAEGGSAVLGVSGRDLPPLRLYWADFRSRPAGLDRFALVVLTAGARTFASRQERALEQQLALLGAPLASRPDVLLLLRKDNEASVEPARRLARSLGLTPDRLFFSPGPGPTEAFLNAVDAFQRARLTRLFAEVNQWSRAFMIRQRARLGAAQSRENEASREIDRMCARADRLENAFKIRRGHWMAGQWRRLDALLKSLLRHLRDEGAIVRRLMNFDAAAMPRGAHSSPQRLAREIAEFWSGRLREEVERWDAEGESRIQAHLEASRRACLQEVFDASPATQPPHCELEAALEADVFAHSPAAPAPDLLRLGCSLEAAFAQSTWDMQALAPHDSAQTVRLYRGDRKQALERYLLYWRQYCLDLQLLRSFLLSLQPHLHPQLLSRRLGALKPRAVELLSREVGGELYHFRQLEDLTREQQDAFRAACHVISLVNLFHARHMSHDAFRRADLPPLPDLQPTGPYCYHHNVRLGALRGEMASLKIRADPVSQSNVLDLYTEIKAWEQLSHEGFPGIAHLYGTMTLGGRLSFVFEGCDGRLSDLLRADRSLVPHLQTNAAARLRSLQQLCRFARQLFSATFFLHRRRFVHRDLATETILYNHGDWTYELKLCNFTVSGINTDIFDTMTYLSWYDTAMHGQKLALSPALDMCNLGLVLWEIYHGEPVAPQPMRSERSLIPGFEAFDGPAPLRELILRCTSREEALRPTEADEPDILHILRSREALGARRRSEER